MILYFEVKTRESKLLKVHTIKSKTYSYANMKELWKEASETLSQWELVLHF